LDFAEIENLRRELRAFSEAHVVSLMHYYDEVTGGFRHTYASEVTKKDFSKTSTGTCVLSLVATDRWNGPYPWAPHTDRLLSAMATVEGWKSAGLPKENPFTVSFLLEAVAGLREASKSSVSPEIEARVEEGLGFLIKSLRRRKAPAVFGAASIKDYPPSAFLTQLVVRVLKRYKRFNDPVLITSVRKWSWVEIEHGLALSFSTSKTADSLSLAYALMTFLSCADSSELTPDEGLLIETALNRVFEAQLPDGSWPRSKPLFHYPKFGNAYCFEYEMLTQLLQYAELTEHLLRHLPELSAATRRLRESAFNLGENGFGWASGHHPQLRGPESWSTASVYHFLHELDRVLAEAVRREVFKYVGAEYLPPGKSTEIEAGKPFAPTFLDSIVQVQSQPKSLRDTIFHDFIRPVAANALHVERGRDLPRIVPMSAIFFGPPGTAKTQLAKQIAEYMSWPLLSLDPSHLVRRGLDQIQAEANMLFSMLASLERVVVLLDEFDELVRERTSHESETISRFLTTAMLPKLALINERRRIIFIIATNHIESFDFAIRRPGRFDLVVQIMPPTLEAKLNKWPRVNEKLEQLNLLQDSDIGKQLAEFTFAEFAELPARLGAAENSHHAKGIIEALFKGCTLQQKNRDETTWAAQCQEQTTYNRVPFTIEGVGQ